MSDIWFTSDTHFGHANIIEYCNRPFENVEAMDEGLIQNWNARVKPGHTVYHIGDFALRSREVDVENYIRRLNGQIHLILGNHDRKSVLKARGFADRTHYKEIRVGDQKIVLLHYAMKTWNKSHHGSWQLHGHSHGSLGRDFKMKQLDVGVDCWNYTPLSYDEVAQELEKHTFVPVDHHRERRR